MTTDTIYAIGDIHGQIGMLETCHNRIARDRGSRSAIVVHIGDLVDRGPDSRAVVDFLATGDPGWITLKGNHDALFTDWLNDPTFINPNFALPDSHWLKDRLGGLTTLRDYGVDTTRPVAEMHAEALQNIPASHRLFLETLPTSWQSPGLFFAHAGIRPGIALDAQTDADLLWIRQTFHDDPSDHGALIIHGHTPIQFATHYGNRVNIDSGAGYDRPMSVIAIEGTEIFLLTGTGRTRLLPA